MPGAVLFQREARAKRDDALAAALRREGLELVATVTLEEIEHRILNAQHVRDSMTVSVKSPTPGRLLEPTA